MIDVIFNSFPVRGAPGRSPSCLPIDVRQLREAFPWGDVPRYLLHDRDTAFHAWTTTATAMGIHEVVTAIRSPWQNAYAERVIGTPSTVWVSMSPESTL